MAHLKNADKHKPKFQSSYVPMDINAMTIEWAEGATVGEKSYVSELDEIFSWMRTHVNGWYGWANDVKGTFFDFMSVMKSKFDGWKWGMMKQEDMSSFKYTLDDGKKAIRITASSIFNNLIWAYTGKTPYGHYAKKHYLEKISLDEYHEAAAWVSKHFFIINPQDRTYNNIMDEFKFLYEKYGIDGWLIDPFKSIKLDGNQRTDFMMDDLFINTKKFALETNTCFNFIAHPKSMSDVKEKDGRYKVVNQFMVAGGAAWDNNMDAQFSIYRPERHLNPSDPKVHFHNLKQRQAEIVGVSRGSYEFVRFDNKSKRYFFNGVCPLDGSRPPEKFPDTRGQNTPPNPDLFTTSANADDLPF